MNTISELEHEIHPICVMCHQPHTDLMVIAGQRHCPSCALNSWNALAPSTTAQTVTCESKLLAKKKDKLLRRFAKKKDKLLRKLERELTQKMNHMIARASQKKHRASTTRTASTVESMNGASAGDVTQSPDQ